jgi:hypothetical protein
MTLERIINYSIIVSVIISIAKFKTTDKKFYPFYFYLWISCANEIISDLSIYFLGTNAINSNIYVLTSSLILVNQQCRWDSESKKIKYYIIYALILLTWITDNLFFSKLTYFNTYNRIFIYTILILSSLYQLSPSKRIQNYKLENEVIFFLLAIFIIKYSITSIVEITLLCGNQLSFIFQKTTFYIIIFSSPIINLLYIMGVIWIPKKENIFWQSYSSFR